MCIKIQEKDCIFLRRKYFKFNIPYWKKLLLHVMEV